MSQIYTENNKFKLLKANTNYSVTVKVSSTDENVQPKEIQKNFVTGDLGKWITGMKSLPEAECVCNFQTT